MMVLMGLSGCANTKTKISNEEKYKNYTAAIEAVINNKGVVSTTIPFTYQTTIVPFDENGVEYHYSLIIDEPQVAMYDIEVIAVDLNRLDAKEIFPSAGIVDESDSMIPYQVNAQKGYPRGIILEGISPSAEFTMEVMVTWRDYSKLNVYHAYFPVTFSYQSGEVNE